MRGLGSLVEFPTGPQQQRAGRGDVDLVVGHHLLDHAEVAEAGAEGLALHDVVDGDVVRASGGTEPAHHVGHAAGARRTCAYA